MAEKEIAFKISVNNQDAVKGIDNVTKSVDELAQAQKLLDNMLSNTDLGASNFKELTNEIPKHQQIQLHQPELPHQVQHLLIH